MTNKVFTHPYTKRVLDRDSDGNLFCPEDNRGDVFKRSDNCYDFVVNPSLREMRNIYDEHYTHWPTYKMTLAAVTEPWFNSTEPWYKTMLENLGTISGCQVLLLGNGMSYKEYYFLHLGAHVVFTDLSLMAVRRAQSVFRNSELWEMYREQIEFHAVDATHLPFPDESFDVIYGVKMAPFLNNLPEFFSEVSRCLKPGGICRFTDDAYSPAWDYIRRTLMQPIKTGYLWKGMSPLERARSGGDPAGSFGIKEESLIPFIEQFGFRRLVFIREFFFLRIAQFCWAKLFGWKAKRLRYAKPLFLAMKWIDNRFIHTNWMQRNSLPLTWGFDK